jgi:hypothetical protein
MRRKLTLITSTLLTPILGLAGVHTVPVLAVAKVDVPESWGAPESLAFLASAVVIFGVLIRFGLMRRFSRSAK